MRTRSAFLPVGFLSCCLTLLPTIVVLAEETRVDVQDAYVRGDADGQRWKIGTKGIEMAFEYRGGFFCLTGLQNKTVDPPLNYVDENTTGVPFLTATQNFVEQYAIESVWAKPLVGSIASLDPGANNVRIAVKKGEMIGLSVGARGDFTCDHVRWPATFDYGDGESYTSTSDAILQQGPMWFSMIRIPGTGWMEPMDAIEEMASIKEKIRIPTEKSGYRAPGTTPQIGGQSLHPSNDYDAVRVWKAPKDGTVCHPRQGGTHSGGRRRSQRPEDCREDRRRRAAVSCRQRLDADERRRLAGGRRWDDLPPSWISP